LLRTGWTCPPSQGQEALDNEADAIANNGSDLEE